MRYSMTEIASGNGHEQASQRTIASRMIRLEEPPHGKFAKFNDQ